MIVLTSLLEDLVAQKWFDLHLVVGEPPVFRINGALKRQGEERLDAAQMEALLLPLLNPAELASLEQRRNVEKSLRHNDCRFRLNVFRERGNLAASVRLSPSWVPTLEKLGLGTDEYPVFQQIVNAPRGLVMVIGPSGSGKDTTVAAMIEEINRTRAARILTIESPIEFDFEPKQSVITQQAVGEDVHEFPAALRSAMNADPDVLLLWEQKNLECLHLMLQFADAGHLVFTSRNAHSPSEAVQQLIEVWPEYQRPLYRRLVAQNLVAVISQRLLPRIDRPGRVAAQEILTLSSRVRQMIADGQTDLTVAIEAGRSLGMQTMDDSLVRLCERGIISPEIAWLNLENKERLRPQ